MKMTMSLEEASSYIANNLPYINGVGTVESVEIRLPQSSDLSFQEVMKLIGLAKTSKLTNKIMDIRSVRDNSCQKMGLSECKQFVEAINENYPRF